MDTPTDAHGSGAQLDAPHRTDATEHLFMDGPTMSGTTAKLLLSEVSLGPGGQEFVEIVNPSTQAVDLSTYYLSDNGAYFKLPAGTPAIQSGDFIVQFPTGASIAGHAVITVAIGSAVNFTGAFGVAPTYSIADGTMSPVVTMSPSLTDAGELVVLFQWDGTAPLVKDVDMVLAGVPTASNSYIDKSGYTQNAGTYATDANTLAVQASAPPGGKSTKRIALETGHQLQNGNGNGITGDDETSEDTSATWDTTATFSVPTPGQVPAALLQ